VPEETSTNYDTECFLIAPIGKEGTPTRKRSDGVREFIVKPAVAELGLTTVRADDLRKPGQITLQVIEHVLRAKGAVADITGANPNVFYELAVRHTAKLPVVLIAEADEIDRLPFDIAQMRVIPFDHRDLASAASAKEQITAHLREALGGALDSPIATVLNVEALEQGNAVEQTLAQLVNRVEDLVASNAVLARQIRRSRPGGLARKLGDATPVRVPEDMHKQVFQGATKELITLVRDTLRGTELTFNVEEQPPDQFAVSVSNGVSAVSTLVSGDSNWNTVRAQVAQARRMLTSEASDEHPDRAPEAEGPTER
jgi:hypothetical protein